jgi:plastocyanin
MTISKKLSLNTTAIIIAVVVHFFYTGVAIAVGEQQTHVLEIRNSQFTPAEITVNVGDTIKWINRDIVPHTATADDKSWDSKLIGSGEEWELVVKTNMSTSYFCTFHPGMKAKIQINR